MKLEYLNDFLVFSQTMNYSKAARRLYTTQPSLSNHIRALEREIGVKLVTEGQNPQLTGAGRELIGRASELINQYNDMLSAVRLAGTEAEDITILINEAAMGALGNLRHLNLLYLSANPHVFITTPECSDSSVRSALANSGADAVACYDCPLDADLANGIRFVTLPDFHRAVLALWLHKSHPLASTDHLTWDDVKILDYAYPHNICRLWAATTAQAFANHGVRINGRDISAISARFFFGLHDNEVQLFDTGFEQLLNGLGMEDRILKPIEGEDSRSLLYLGYDPKRVSRAFANYLAFIEEVKAERGEAE